MRLVCSQIANEFINIKVSEDVNVALVRIIEVMGRLVFQEPMPENSMQLDVGELLPGIYLLEVQTKEGFREVKQILIE